MEKYYTPEIEEFHVGFEFETLEKNRDASGNSSWNKWEFRNAPTFIKFIFDKYFMTEKADGIRVKYLDIEDVESFDFNCMQVNKRKISGYKFKGLEKLEDGLWCDSKIMITVRYLTGRISPWVTIREFELNDPEKEYSVEEIQEIKFRIRFDGCIKNKSELKLILKKLEI